MTPFGIVFLIALGLGLALIVAIAVGVVAMVEYHKVVKDLKASRRESPRHDNEEF